MKKLFFFLFISISLTASAQNNIDDINRLFDYYCNQGLFTNASNLLVEKGNEYLVQGDTLMAYELQLKNCHFTDEHQEEFFNNGLTWEDYFANWYITISLAAWLNMKDEIAPVFLRVLEKISQKEPKLLPFYASTLRYILYEYKETDGGVSIYVLQKALDYIESVSPTHDLAKQYNKIVDCFYINRFYNSFENNILYANRYSELEKWYINNHQYLNKLDPFFYKREIIEYELLFVDQVMTYASTYAAQAGKPYEAIEMYNKAVSVLEPLVSLDENLSQKIAACYAHISSLYYYPLGDIVLCKEYCDRAFPYLINHKEDFDYCDILNSLALMFFYTNQNSLASSLKLEEITMREKLGWHCSLTDWSMYFMYIQNTEPEKIIEYKDYALTHAAKNEGGCPDFYQSVGKAYSRLLQKDPKNRAYAEDYFNKADSVFNSNKDYFDKYNLSDNFMFNLTQARAELCLRLGHYQEAYNLYQEALTHLSFISYGHLSNVSLMASYLHDTDKIHTILPIYYQGLTDNLSNILPVLGSVESDTFLGDGESALYHIPEWASWNPTDSVSVSIAYNAVLMMKGLTLRYNTLTPYFENNPEMINAKRQLDRMRDSIYIISEENSRLLALHIYQLKEREILKDINDELITVSWQDVSKRLKDDEACIEFVKYTANTYPWSDSIPKPHYAAMVLLPNGEAPIFVDLFDEDDLLDVYELQPKSYDIEIGQILYSKIWGKMHRYIEGKNRVFFSPMGLLNLINIELLADSTGRTATERFNLHRVSSTRNIIEKNENIDLHFVASFGGVDYENAQEFADMMRSINTRGNWAYLQNTLLEVNNIEDLLKDSGVDVTTYTGPRATESVFKQLDGTQADIIHIATHGYYIPQLQRTSISYFANSESAESIQDELFYSGLILSGGQKAWIDSSFKPDNNDGILTAYEISKLDLHNVDLVVLSACETGLGDDLFDGIFGLQRAFKKAGVGSILMSLWQIDDKVTSEYMRMFYEKLADGNSIHEAYIGTLLSMKDKYPDANYWASFVLLD